MRCPTCDSPAPHLHPAVQHEGEVETCTDDFHLIETPSNTHEYRDYVLTKRREINHPQEKAQGEL